MMNFIFLILIVISFALNAIIFVFYNAKLKKTNKLLEEVSESSIEFENLLLKALGAEYELLNTEFRGKYKEFTEDVVANLDAVKNEKQKLAIEDAILILQKQDNNWFDKKFVANKPTSALIEDVFNEKYQPNEERYTQFIDEIRKESDL